MRTGKNKTTSGTVSRNDRRIKTKKKWDEKIRKNEKSGQKMDKKTNRKA